MNIVTAKGPVAPVSLSASCAIGPRQAGPRPGQRELYRQHARVLRLRRLLSRRAKP